MLHNEGAITQMLRIHNYTSRKCYVTSVVYPIVSILSMPCPTPAPAYCEKELIDLLVRHLEIRLRESLAEGCRITSDETHLLIDMQIDYPWRQVLQAIDGCSSSAEQLRIWNLFESFVPDRRFEFNGEYVAIYEWTPEPSVRFTPES